MIAPIRGPRARSGDEARGLAIARRAVAATLFRRPAHDPASAQPVSPFLAIAFVAWVVAIAALYFTVSTLRNVPRY